jgi:hypothetical protein
VRTCSWLGASAGYQYIIYVDSSWLWNMTYGAISWLWNITYVINSWLVEHHRLWHQQLAWNLIAYGINSWLGNIAYRAFFFR